MKKQYVYSFSMSGNLTIELEDDEDTDQRVKDILKGMSSTNEEVKDYSCYDVELTLECEEEDEMKNREPATFEPGTYVVNTTRMPHPLQPWLHEVYVGIVDEPTEDTLAYNQLIRELYPMEPQKVRVLYPFGLVDERVDNLIPITPDEAQLSFRNKIKRFMSEESLRYYDKASCQLDIPEEERI